MEIMERKEKRGRRRMMWYLKERRRHKVDDPFRHELHDPSTKARRRPVKRHSTTGRKSARPHVACMRLFVAPRRTAALFTLQPCSF